MSNALAVSPKHRGVTFIELLVTIAIIAILAAIAVPYYGDYIERQRWVGATEAVYGQMQQAKRLAISNNIPIYFIAVSDASGSWCLTYSEAPSTGCSDSFVTSSSANPSVSISGENYPGIALTASSATWPKVLEFRMPGLGGSTGEGLIVTSSRLGDIEVILGSRMNVTICSDDLARYECD